MGLDLDYFSKINKLRCQSIDGFDHKLSDWIPEQWTNAAAGEMGECANLTKKIGRHRMGMPGNIKQEDKNIADLFLNAVREAADVIIYLDLFIQSCGYNTSEIVKQKFNDKSKELDCSIILV